MSNLNFSKGKFGKFLSSKGFYVAVALCLVGAGTATWLAVDRTITGIEDNNNQMIESENKWQDYPQLEQQQAEGVEKKQGGVDLPPAAEPSQQPSGSSTSSSSSEPSAEPTRDSEPSPLSEPSRSLDYVLPIKNDIINPYSAGELVKNATLGDWRTHDGIDIKADKGTEVLASTDGVVSSVKNDALWGTVITIDHADGTQTIYCGLDKVMPVQEGSAVLAKQVIGTLDGVPGEISDPSHLHFAVKRDGKYIDPLSLMEVAD